MGLLFFKKIQKRITSSIFIYIILIAFLLVVYSRNTTTTNSYIYKSSNNVDYVGFENVVMHNTFLSPYAWKGNKGLLKFNPVQGGVFARELNQNNFNAYSYNISSPISNASLTGTLFSDFRMNPPVHSNKSVAGPRNTLSIALSTMNPSAEEPALFDVISGPVQSIKKSPTIFIIFLLTVTLSILLLIFIIRKIRKYMIKRSKMKKEINFDSLSETTNRQYDSYNKII